MSIDKYIISESSVYTPFDIQEGYHNLDDNIGATINVDRTLHRVIQVYNTLLHIFLIEIYVLVY